jgi:hypothetical protein
MMSVRTYVGMSLLATTASLAGCMAAQDAETTDSSTVTPAAANVSLAKPSAEQAAAEDPGAGCTAHFEYTLTDDNRDQEASFKPAATCPADTYFHPTNGAPGGWIESWRLCNQGGGVFQICCIRVA